MDAANVVSFCSLFGVDGGPFMRLCPFGTRKSLPFLCNLKTLPVLMPK